MDIVDPSRVDGSAHWEDRSQKQSFDEELFYLKPDGLMHRHRATVVFWRAFDVCGHWPVRFRSQQRLSSHKPAESSPWRAPGWAWRFRRVWPTCWRDTRWRCWSRDPRTCWSSRCSTSPAWGSGGAPPAPAAAPRWPAAWPSTRIPPRPTPARSRRKRRKMKMTFQMISLSKVGDLSIY